MSGGFIVTAQSSFLQLNSIFISILIEAIPFILIGVILSGIIQMFVSEEMIARIMPKNRFLAVLFGALAGVLFPACECGIIPITRRLLLKGVPLHAGVAFMLTAPIINPIVLFSTFIAFGNRWSVVFYRGGLALAVSVIIGIILSYQFKDNQLLKPDEPGHHHHHHHTLLQKLGGTLRHAIDEFFSVGKYLIIGAFIAAAMQTYVKTSTLLAIGQNDVSSSLVMMGLAFVLSLCSEVDAFIASSFSSTFSLGSLIAFLVFGAMVDIKNLLMMLAAFKKRFVFLLITYIVVIVLAGSLLVKG
ncbi:putative permease [Bacillus spizizenii str. W23]|uniref:Putative permease n=1 Tax=Bacillus spizizenii (strain ATCC 23059 / NRRL B-14472 / W23) TaxID=655816 RepID=E0U1P1_BACSH|nr:permease [Bacillus spizizenii]ADM36389.1 putative permease [Bacillus spizizenii str. W23]EFG90851.1 putative permease [Bacillus spizizenii ATCC 6633 = JCM 2499]KFI03986.1 membrane protein [Bacillus sp. BSC154]AJW85843.1 membrane protein [Bacillus spizizenii]KFK78865.1 putative permease family protein [Bacillus spizizenii]